MTRRHMWLALAAIIVTNTGCYSTWDVAPRALGPLNNFHEPEKVSLTDVEGDRFTFDQNTQLHFDGNEAPFTKFSSIQVAGDAFAGITAPDSRPFTISLQQVKVVQAKRWSLWKTTLLVSAITLAVLVTATVILLAAAANNSGQ